MEMTLNEHQLAELLNPRAVARALRGEGKSLVEIAEITGVPYNTVYRYIRSDGPLHLGRRTAEVEFLGELVRTHQKARQKPTERGTD